MFEPIEKSNDRFYERIIDKIKAMIVQGKLRQGESLPTERELADMFGVSRVPVREALKTLEYIGMIENIKGKGLFIKKRDVREILNKLDISACYSEGALDDFYEFRLYVESSAAEIAALRRTEEDISMMEKTISMMKQILTRYEIEQEMTEQLNELCTEASWGFHFHVVQATKNQVFIDSFENIHNMLHISTKMYFTSCEYLKASISEHRAVLDMIIAQDPVGAKEKLWEHLKKANLRVLDCKKNLMPLS